MSDDYLKASLYSYSLLDANATSNAVLYMRNATIPVNNSIDTAINLGTLTTDETQLDAQGAINRLNANHFYKFTLDGDNLKLNYTNTTATVSSRVQILNSAGTVVADSSTTASQTLQDSYAEAISSDGFATDAGDYYVKVSFESTSPRSVPQAYILSLYSGTKFSSSYQTTAVSQTNADQHIAEDNTMVFSTSNALEYTVDACHLANETANSAINIGWLYEDKGALFVKGQLTTTCDEEYYSLTLQKGETLKMAVDNQTDTSALRVQLLDATGTIILADSDGTDAQKEAYEALLSSDGLAANTGNYVYKVSYKQGEDKNKEQIYTVKVYSGTSYSALYETTATAEMTDTAILNGHLTPDYSPVTTLAAYLKAEQSGESISVIDKLKELAIADSASTLV